MEVNSNGGYVRSPNHQFPGRKKEKWKIQHHRCRHLQFLIFLQAVVFVLQPVWSQTWDGVIVTQADFEALQAFKHDLIDPQGFLKSWNDSGAGACSGGWAGIKCAQGQVIVIQLPWRGLAGKITEKIGQFQALRKLSLHDNFISGAIPTSLGFLPNLRGLQLFNNRLSGSIPASLGLCPLLQTLDLSNNSLSGAIPGSLVNSTKLFRLNLSHNSLTGSIPVRFALSPSLIFLALEHNNLSGPVPDSWGGGKKNVSLIQVLTIGHNSLNGSLPDSLSNLGQLSVLDLRSNDFTGRIPPSIGSISSLKTLDLAQNNLAGEIPAAVAGLPNLESFNVSYNNLSGQVPKTLSEKFNSTAFTGNLLLCGYSPSTPCPLSPSEAPPAGPAPKRRRRKLSTKDIILIAAGVLLVILLVTCCILLCCLLRKRRISRDSTKSGGGAASASAASRSEKGTPQSAAATEGGEGGGGESGGKLVHFDGPMAFSADDLLCATAEIMGKSTYGTVYKATMEDGIQVAVKRLREKITKGQREFEHEVNELGKIRHPNLLALRAYYLGPKGEKLLVFDYMPKGSLATFLHARAPDAPVDWPTRMKICKGMTRGVMYLHTNVGIVHGNLTSSNVLLDEQGNARIGDYGLSRLMTAAANANVMATAAALGYRAPELSKLKKATTKSDVYSLGVIVLEILTGKSPGGGAAGGDGQDLPQWVASIVKEEWTNEVFDLELMRDAAVIGDELLNTLKLALHCVDPSPSARPEAHQILQQLEEIRPESAGGTSSGDDGGAAVTSSPAAGGGD
ncbi:probable leucine-rich repeat receptor-like protein kinase IMK3 [Andrographis paniculata]|uniref:probable leucine-rich repeat receptor-like protein kinase IMK3 n=1 Tax=Andrographis paniculata TaxID=175694 RepID=UPI0021E8F532|nr:probable leucine-rich repeat receptor-like protein kinase IMK3 [Andrographis paniculata]